ncbi:hypothetical protein PIB30_076638 [Stylosanthes scabra]|uniref:Uncharacterized protein n=1 Tax=Stylosanthes scabra TaxID=79078 RepID=A0ABU6SRV1_9FABA|nr:hypothetical protein [Stylosanthes scabra]
MAYNNQHFKARATSVAKGIYEVTPSESTVLAKSLVDIAAMLKEIKEGQQAIPKILTQQSHNPPQMLVRHCSICSCSSHYTENAHSSKRITSLHLPTIIMKAKLSHHQTINTTNKHKDGETINKAVGIPTNHLNTANLTTTIHHKTPKDQDTNLHIIGNHIHPPTIFH